MSRNLEKLENRRLMSVGSISLSADGTLSVFGSSSNDAIQITTSDGTLTATENINNQTYSVPASSVKQIYVDGYYGDDSITIDAATTQPATLSGNIGNDTLTGGGGPTTIIGGAGSDQLSGSSASTADFSAQTSDLTITSSFNGNITAVAADGSGTDTLSGFGRLLGGRGNDHIALNYVTGPLTYIDGGAGDDSISSGNDGLNTIHGGDGNDTLTGSNGHFVFYGDDGNDTFTIDRDSRAVRDWYGGTGTDTLDMSGFSNEYNSVQVSLDDVANDGNELNALAINGHTALYLDNAHSDIEIVIGGPAPDTIIGSAHNETLIGGGGNDSLVGNSGDDSLDGGFGADTLVGSTGNDTFNATWGNDSIVSGGGIDTTIHADLPDWVSINNGVLTITGTDGNDNITFYSDNAVADLYVRLNSQTAELPRGAFGSIVVNAGAGDDSVSASDAREKMVINGGDGNDSLYGDLFASDTLNGDEGNDSLLGDAGNDSLDGGAGTNTLLGGDGDDTITSHSGTDHIDGGSGTNTITTTSGTTTTPTDPTPPSNPAPVPHVQYTLSSGGMLTLDGTSADDTITLTNHSGGYVYVTVNGVQTHFKLSTLTFVVIDGGDGNDNINMTGVALASKIYGAAGDDTLVGGAGKDRIYGGDGDDWIDGGDNNDTLYGQAGNDRLFGGAGVDRLDAGSGINVLRGGEGRDAIFGSKTDDLHANIGDVIALI